MPKIPLFALSVLVAGILAVIRFRKIDRIFLPFILCIWAACLNEGLGYFLFMNGYHTSVNNNIYVLTEALLFILFFKNMNLFGEFGWLFVLFFAMVICTWVWENLIMGKITGVSSWFRIAYSFLIVLMSITLINRLLITDIYKSYRAPARSVWLNPILLICIGAIIFFTFKLLVEIFWLYGLNGTAGFRIQLYRIMVYVNLAVNLIYALAILCMPQKQPYITL